MKNKLIDLNNHLFMQLERLTDESLKGDDLSREIARSKAVSNMAQQIICNARLALDAQIAVHDNLIKSPAKMLGIEGYDEKA